MSWHFDGERWWWITSDKIITYSNTSDPKDWNSSAWVEPQTEPPVTQEQCNVAERETAALLKRLKK